MADESKRVGAAVSRMCLLWQDGLDFVLLLGLCVTFRLRKNVSCPVFCPNGVTISIFLKVWWLVSWKT